MNILHEIENEFNQKPQEVAKTLGISKSYYSMLKNEKQSISKNVAILIHECYKIPLENILLRPQVHASKTKSTGTEG